MQLWVNTPSVQKRVLPRPFIRAKTQTRLATPEQRFGKRLRHVRLMVGESLQQLADVCGVNKTTVMRWEAGEGGLRAGHMLRLLAHYKRFERYLLHGDAADPEPAPQMNEVLRKFLKTPIGQECERRGLTVVLSSIQFQKSPGVQLYHRLALALLGEPEDSD